MTRADVSYLSACLVAGFLLGLGLMTQHPTPQTIAVLVFLGLCLVIPIGVVMLFEWVGSHD